MESKGRYIWITPNAYHKTSRQLMRILAAMGFEGAIEIKPVNEMTEMKAQLDEAIDLIREMKSEIHSEFCSEQHWPLCIEAEQFLKQFNPKEG